MRSAKRSPEAPSGAPTVSMAEESYPRATVVMVPFPFTDLSGSKRRPALVVSPEGFSGEDLILCAITSRVPGHLSEWEVLLEAGDMREKKLPKPSVIRVGKLFTVHRGLISGSFGTVEQKKLSEVLERLRELFAEEAPEATEPAEHASP